MVYVLYLLMVSNCMYLESYYHYTVSPHQKARWLSKNINKAFRLLFKIGIICSWYVMMGWLQGMEKENQTKKTKHCTSFFIKASYMVHGISSMSSVIQLDQIGLIASVSITHLFSGVACRI